MEEYKEYMEVASKILKDNNDWMSFKKVMLQSVPSNMRKRFSTRHPKTKKQTLNEFEEKIIDIYFSRTGIKLILEEKND